MLPADFGTPAVPVALVAADSEQVIQLLVAEGRAGRVDTTSSGTAVHLTDIDLNPALITIEMGRSFSGSLGLDVTLLRDLDPRDPDETGNFVIHPDGSFWPVPPARLPALVAQIPTLIRPDDVWLIANRPTGKRANASEVPSMPDGLHVEDPISVAEWFAGRIRVTGEDPPCQTLAAPQWSGLTVIVRATSREVTIWRAGKGNSALHPLSWGYERTWVHPNHGTITRDAASPAAAFATSWRRAGGTVAEATLVELHKRRWANNAVLGPALTALGLPAGLVSQLCSWIPTAELSLVVRSRPTAA